MSRFWRYFHEKLNWPLIFRPGPISALVRGLALYMDDVREDILWLRDQWNPQTADESLIAAYGESRGILRNRYDTDESYRLRVVNAYAWHKLGGKVSGLVRILAENGFHGAVIESVNDVRRHDAALMHNGRATYNAGLCWAQFDVKFVEIPESGLNSDIANWFRWLVNEYKPARSILRAMSWGITISDATSASDITWIKVVPEYNDIRPWGFPAHDGSICYNNGIFRLHNGRLSYGGEYPHTRWEPCGHRHDNLLDPLNLAAGISFSNLVRPKLIYNGFSTHQGWTEHGSQNMPCLDASRFQTSLKPFSETVPFTEIPRIAVAPRNLDWMFRCHNGSLFHGPHLRNGQIFYDGAMRHDSGVFRLHDGRIFYSGKDPHDKWLRNRQLHNATANDEASFGARPQFVDIQKSQPLHNGMMRRKSAGRHGKLDAPALDAAKVSVAPIQQDAFNLAENHKLEMDASLMDSAGRWHDGSMSHGQRRMPGLHNGMIFHDGSRKTGPFGGNSRFDCLRRNGKIRRGSGFFHRRWNIANDDAAFTYQSLGEICVAKAVMDFGSDTMRYAQGRGAGMLYNGKARRGELDAPSVDIFRLKNSLKLHDDAGPSEKISMVSSQKVSDRAVHWHDGTISRGQKLATVRTGSAKYDGARPHTVFGGLAVFASLKHDGKAKSDGLASHNVWNGRSGVFAPQYLHRSLSDIYCSRLSGNFTDHLEIGDHLALSVTRWTFRKGAASYDAQTRHSGKEYR